MPTEPKFEIKLSNGRIIGPIDPLRVRVLIEKNQVNGTEQARALPDGEWRDINRHPELADLLLQRLEQGTEVFARGTKNEESDQTAVLAGSDAGASSTLPGLSDTQAVSLQDIPTAVPQSSSIGSAPGGVISSPAPTVEMDSPSVESKPASIAQSISLEQQAAPPVIDGDEEEKTLVATQAHLESGDFQAAGDPDGEATVVANIDQMKPSQSESTSVNLEGDASAAVPDRSWSESVPSQEKTTVFDTAKAADDAGILSKEGKKQFKEKKGFKKYLRPLLFGILVALFATDYVDLGKKKDTKKNQPVVIRPRLPSYLEGQSNPTLSKQIYKRGLQAYSIDHVKAYVKAIKLFQKSAALDINNVQAVAMLASSYLRLIDSSNKDESYFQTISKLIELSRAKNVDLLETVLADIEFYLATNQLDAAEKRIDEYTRVNRQYGIDMFFYLGEISARKRQYDRAVTFINRIPDNKVFSPRIFHLRGKLAESLGFDDQALTQYTMAVKRFRGHPKSRVRLASVLDRLGRLREAKEHLNFLVNNITLLDPPDRGEALFLAGRYFQLEKNEKLALQVLEAAVKADPKNHDYLFEYFTLKARMNDGVKGAKDQARMFYFLGEGEKFVSQGQYESALNSFLQARQANTNSPLPLVKIGRMFQERKNHRNALLNLRKANKLAPKSMSIWASYIESLIENYEWEEAAQAIASFRQVAKKKSTADRLTGDLYMRQGAAAEAIVFYRKAMSHRNIDRAVYLEYAKAMLSGGRPKEASFYFNLVRRFDPLNMEAVIGNARAIAELQGLDDAIEKLQTELQRLKEPRVELITAVGEFHFKRRQWEQAMAAFEEAINLNPDFAPPWLWKAKVYLEGETSEKKPKEKALEAFKSYSDRNPSDPTGYLERYRVFVSQTKFDQAGEELDRIFALFPKYPAVHFYKGALYSEMGNLATAQREFEIELKNHPSNVQAMLELGKVKVRGKAYKEALNLFNRAMVAQPSAAEPKHLAGYANFLLKNYMGAIALLKSAAHADSGNPMIFKRLGEVYRTTGDGPSARAAFTKYLQLAPDAPDREEIQKLIN